MSRVKATPIPHACPDCVERIYKLVEQSDDMQQFLHYCPHNKTLIYTEHDDIGDTRFIRRWMFEAPCSERHYLDMAHSLAQKLGAEMQTYYAGAVN